VLREFTPDDAAAAYTVGQELTVDGLFKVGDRVDVSARHQRAGLHRR